MCDVKDCNCETYMGWRPHTTSQGRQICEHHWQRHRDVEDKFDLFEAFKQARPWVFPKPKRQPVRAKTPLQRFVRDICKSWDDHYSGCMFRTGEGKPSDNPLDEEASQCECLVFNGKRCAHFEKAVLHPPTCRYKHQCFIDDPSFEQAVRAEYAIICPAQQEDERSCAECGAVIGPPEDLLPKLLGEPEKAAKSGAYQR